MNKILLTRQTSHAGYEDYNVVKATGLNQLDQMRIDNGELEGLYLDSILELVPFNKVGEVVGLYAKKVKVGGQLIIHGSDFTSIARNHTFFGAGGSIHDVNAYLYGQLGQQSILSRELVAHIFQQNGVAVQSQFVIDNYYTVKGVRS